MAEFQDRQLWDLPAWPELQAKVRDLRYLVFAAEPGPVLNQFAFTIASLAAGCRHCQAHGAYGLDRLGVPLEKIQALWSFESSDLFDARERAALSFALAAGATPNAVTPEHHEELRRNFTDPEVRTLFAVVAMSGFTNRYNDSLGTVTDAASADWAGTNLADVGWTPGKHRGARHERRSERLNLLGTDADG